MAFMGRMLGPWLVDSQELLPERATVHEVMPFRDPLLSTAPCPHCARKVDQGTEVCPHCQSPIDFDNYTRMVLTLEPAQKRARRWLAICAGIQAPLAFLTYAAAGLPHRATGQIAIAIFFAVAWLLARKWPLGAPLAVAGLFGMSEVAGLVLLGPKSLLIGVVLKIFLMTALVKGVSAGYEIRDLRRQAKPHDRRLLLAFAVGCAVVGVALGLALSAQR
jgi:RNA polymerase subunit RPABC4/transcription elongation factor Spt4